MMARKKRHFFIFNITKFYKFNEYIIVDRPMALIHVYSRKNVESGRFIYIRKKHLENLWRDYRFSKKRSYKKYQSKKVKGTFPDILNIKYKNNVLSEFDYGAYEKKKDKAIESIGKEKNKKSDKWLEQRDNIIRGLKKLLKLNSNQTKEILDGWDVKLKGRTIREICPMRKSGNLAVAIGRQL